MEQNKKTEIWPYAIIASFVLFAGFIFYAVGTAMSHDTPLVTQDYYAEEIAFQGQIDRQQRAKDLDKMLAFEFDRQARTISVQFPQEAGQNGALSGKIKLFRPSDDGLDRTFEIETNLDGEQILDVKGIRPGYWQIKVDWQEGETGFYQEEDLII